MKSTLKLLLKLPPETAHSISIRALKTGIVPGKGTIADPRLETRVAGITFPNPVGLAAGYDKNGEVPDRILSLGFGSCEVGTVTPKPQAGNSKPRIFRLRKVQGVINRLGFNNEGHEALYHRLQHRRNNPGIVGVNIGANKDTSDFITDYEIGVRRFNELASYFTVNISSPNTPGLRALQTEQTLKQLIERVSAVREELAANGQRRIPMFIKIAPDLQQSEMDAITGIIENSTIDGLIISNTTVSRKTVSGQNHAEEVGGLSGKPLFVQSTAVLAQMRQRLGDHFPLIGVGGIDSTESAIEKLSAGANLLQLYTGMIYRGPQLASEICGGLLRYLDTNGLKNIAGVTGGRVSEWAERFDEEAS